jgi:uncharacterized repeat protein (TIGR03847 family)
MPGQVFDLNPVTRITTDAVGPPGQRVFYLQARQGAEVVTLIVEKEHIAALAEAADRLLLMLAGDDPVRAVDTTDVPEQHMELDWPLEPAFRVGHLALGYDEVGGNLVIVCYELVGDDDPDDPSIARFWVTPRQMRSLSQHGQEVVAAGRPVCAMCGQPIDPEGHFCVRKNGHRS